jgi:hypothetical protein
MSKDTMTQQNKWWHHAVMLGIFIGIVIVSFIIVNNNDSIYVFIIDKPNDYQLAQIQKGNPSEKITFYKITDATPCTCRLVMGMKPHWKLLEEENNQIFDQYFKNVGINYLRITY